MYVIRTLFNPGQIVATPAALKVAQEHKIVLAKLITRHVNGDWGDLDEEDKKANMHALASGARLLSSYGEGETKLWVITEGEDDQGVRQSTTVLRPDDY